MAKILLMIQARSMKKVTKGGMKTNEPLRSIQVSLNRGSIWFYRSYQIYKKFYVRINFIKLILQKIRSSTCKGERGAPELAKIRLQIKPRQRTLMSATLMSATLTNSSVDAGINHIFRARRAAIQNDHPLGGGFGPARRACRFGWPQQFL